MAAGQSSRRRFARFLPSGIRQPFRRWIGRHRRFSIGRRDCLRCRCLGRHSGHSDESGNFSTHLFLELEIIV